MTSWARPMSYRNGFLTVMLLSIADAYPMNNRGGCRRPSPAKSGAAGALFLGVLSPTFADAGVFSVPPDA